MAVICGENEKVGACLGTINKYKMMLIDGNVSANYADREIKGAYDIVFDSVADDQAIWMVNHHLA